MLAGEYVARKILDVGLAEANRVLRGLLRIEGRDSKEKEGELMMMMPQDIRRVLVKRWEQIRDMILGGYKCTGCAPFGGGVSSTEEVGGGRGLIKAEYESTH